jgi:tetratricopeptide (TPR) repeat protein
VKESTNKLAIFIMIFTVTAIILYLTMPAAKVSSTSTIADSEMSVMVPDSTINMILADIDQLKAIVSKNPRDVEHLIQIGNQYFDINRPTESIEYYEKALLIDSTNPFVLTDCAAMYERLGESEKALAYIDKALALKPDLPQAYFNRGLVLYHHKNDAQGAITAWQKFIEIVGDTAQANIARKQIAAVQARQ